MSVPTLSRFARYLAVIVRWLLVVSIVFVLTIFGGVYITNNVLAKVYTATARIQIRPRSDVSPIGNDGMTNNVIDPAAFQAEFGTMESPNVLLSVIKDLGLEKAWAKRVYETDPDEVPDVDALTRIQKMVKIDLVVGTDIVNITVSSDAPKEAAEIANAIADRYKAMRDVGDANHALQESPVRIISRALPPSEPTKPNKRFDFIVTILVACFLSVTTASFVEIIFLLSRASKRMDN